MNKTIKKILLASFGIIFVIFLFSKEQNIKRDGWELDISSGDVIVTNEAGENISFIKRSDILSHKNIIERVRSNPEAEATIVDAILIQDHDPILISITARDFGTGDVNEAYVLKTDIEGKKFKELQAYQSPVFIDFLDTNSSDDKVLTSISVSRAKYNWLEVISFDSGTELVLGPYSDIRKSQDAIIQDAHWDDDLIIFKYFDLDDFPNGSSETWQYNIETEEYTLIK